MPDYTVPQPIELDLTFEAEEVKVGTPYEDEPDEMVPPGHWVRGFEREASTAEFQMRVPVIYDAHNNDVTEHVARMMADVLNQVGARHD